MDLNADVGEGGAHDEALLAIVTSANVACGFHAGGAATMAVIVTLAATRGVAVGAQVSYADRAGFGRRDIDIAPDHLRAEVLYQLGALEALCRAAGTRVRYVKPHGALYHRIIHDHEQARAVVEAVYRYDASLPLLSWPTGAAVEAARRAGVATLAEGFVDRAYTPNGELVPRTSPGALLTTPSEVAAQSLALARRGDIVSLCVHSDTPGAVQLASAARTALRAAGFAVAAMR